MTQGRFLPCNIFEQAKIEETWEGKIAGDKWRSSLHMRIMSNEQLVTMVLEGIEKIDECERNPELESYLTVVFTYFHAGFPGELYEDFHVYETIYPGTILRFYQG
jgi:hypothetical protein